MEKLKLVWWVVIIALTAIFFATAARYATNPDTYLDACVAFFGAIGAALIGFGVLVSDRELTYFAEHRRKLRLALEAPEWSCASAALEEIKRTRRFGFVPPSPAVVACLSKVQSALAEAEQRSARAALEIDLIIERQVRMAGDASKWFAIGICVCLAAAAAGSWLAFKR